MAAALGARAYELCGAEADGAISWVCPGAYLKDVALPALHSGAERAGRSVPPLVAHAPVSVHENPEEARDAIRQQFGFFARSPFYQNMFTAAGFPEVSQGTWSDAMVDAVGIWGDESRRFFAAQPESPLEEFAAEAHRHPVFRVMPQGRE